MRTIGVRELRNHTSALLRDVEAGSTVVVTVQGRAVARLMPLQERPEAMPFATLWSALERAAADPELAEELAIALPDTTDDLVP